MRLYFVRHGQSEANVQMVISNRDLFHPLTELGRQQAEALAQSLAEVPVAAIYSSPIVRAAQTAQIVAARHGLAGRDGGCAARTRLRDHGRPRR